MKTSVCGRLGNSWGLTRPVRDAPFAALHITLRGGKVLSLGEDISQRAGVRTTHRM